MKRVSIILFAIVLCTIFVACSNTTDMQTTTFAESTSSKNQTLHSADNTYDDINADNSKCNDDSGQNSVSDSNNKIQKSEDSTLGSDNNGKTEMENSNSVDVIRNETTTSKNISDDSVNSDKNPNTDKDNNQIDIDNIVGGKYF